MASAAKQHFDVLAYVKTSKALGVKEELAEYQARQFEQVLDIASANTKEEFNVRELATKSDISQLGTELRADIKRLELATKSDTAQLDVKIEQYRFDTLKFVVWTGVGVTLSLGGLLSGLLAKGFHWFG